MDWVEDDGQRWVAAFRKKKMGSQGLLERPEMEGRKTDWIEDDGQRWVAACRKKKMESPGLRESPAQGDGWVEDVGGRWVLGAWVFFRGRW